MTNHIRWMIRRDMEEVLQIEHACFPLSWSEDDFLRALRQRNCIGMVSEGNRGLVGYMVYALTKVSLELLKFAVDLPYRRHGIGTAMVDKLKSKLSSQRRTLIWGTVRESNVSAQLFFRCQGFRCTAIEREPFYDCCEDGYRMEFRLGQLEPEMANVRHEDGRAAR